MKGQQSIARLSFRKPSKVQEIFDWHYISPLRRLVICQLVAMTPTIRTEGFPILTFICRHRLQGTPARRGLIRDVEFVCELSTVD